MEIIYVISEVAKKMWLYCHLRDSINFIAAISWLPPLISYVFHTNLFLEGASFFTAGVDRSINGLGHSVCIVPEKMCVLAQYYKKINSKK